MYSGGKPEQKLQQGKPSEQNNWIQMEEPGMFAWVLIHIYIYIIYIYKDLVRIQIPNRFENPFGVLQSDFTFPPEWSVAQVHPLTYIEPVVALLIVPGKQCIPGCFAGLEFTSRNYGDFTISCELTTTS